MFSVLDANSKPVATRAETVGATATRSFNLSVDSMPTLDQREVSKNQPVLAPYSQIRTASNESEGECLQQALIICSPSTNHPVFHTGNGSKGQYDVIQTSTQDESYNSGYICIRLTLCYYCCRASLR